MKRYIVVVSATLLTLAPMKLLTMQKEKQKTLSKINVQNCAKELAKKYENISEIQETKMLRKGIFETTSVIVQAGKEDVSALKEQRKALRKRLIELEPKQSQELIFDVSSPESDEESDIPKLTTRTFYTKYEKTEQIITKTKNRTLGFEQSISKAEQIKNRKVLEIERLQQALQKAQEEDNNLGTQLATQKEESVLAKEAITILQLKKECLKQNMSEQELSLSLQIKEASLKIIELKRELSELTNSEFTNKEAIENKKKELLAEEKDLKELKSAFEVVKKDLHVVNGKGGIFAPLLFGVGVYSYNSTISDDNLLPEVESLLVDESTSQNSNTPNNQSSQNPLNTSPEQLSFIAQELQTQSPTTNDQQGTNVVIELGEMQTPSNPENTEPSHEEKKDK